MGPAPISTAFLTASLLAVILLELAAAAMGTRFELPRLWLIAAARTTQMLVVMTLAMVQAGGFHVLGLERDSVLPGLGKGLIWSAGFAAAAGLLFLGLFMIGLNPLPLLRSPLPEGTTDRALFFFVGGIVAPVAEEIVFRGVIFGYLRRWGLPAAVLVSTTLFAALHLPAVPITQIVGGMVFAVAYHTGKSLMVPIAIHVLGNLAIFTLSLPLFH
jgi:membrane protease YdiL (CAAX protease family)